MKFFSQVTAYCILPVYSDFLFSSLIYFTFVGDIIIKEGTIGTKMYFIQEGVVDIVMANGEVIHIDGSSKL